VVVRGVLVDDRGVLDQRLEGLDAALDERLLVLGVLVLGVLREVSGRRSDTISSSSWRSFSSPSLEM
jgi:hypothetical protein